MRPLQGPLLLASRQQLQSLVIDKLNPKDCFRSLKGVAAGTLTDRIPVAPVVRLNTSDRRIVPGRDIVAEAFPEMNLASMDCEAFEHLIRQLFEMEFSRDGVTVRVARWSRDRGVDALAFNPDPPRSGKFVIQAKRYTRVVDVSAVRDLYDTVLNEGGNRGILVTTSSSGRDFWEFAQDKPLSLLAGAILLHLLQKHGLRFRIDLGQAHSERKAQEDSLPGPAG